MTFNKKKYLALNKKTLVLLIMKIETRLFNIYFISLLYFYLRFLVFLYTCQLIGKRNREREAKGNGNIV